MPKWYVTIDKQSSYIGEPDECVWTVSRDPNTTGWCTDSGYSGYGLTKADAEELANAANENKRLRTVLKECQTMLEIAFDYDGNVFGKSHNRAVDANLVARAALKDKTNGND